MAIANAAHEFVYSRVKEDSSNCDGDANMLASIRTNRKLLHKHAVLRMKGEIQTKFIIWLWSNTWEEGRLWTTNAIPLSKMSSRLNCEKKNLRLALNGLLATGFVKRTAAENRSFRYCLDFECDWIKFVIALDEELPSEDDVHNSDAKGSEEPPIGVETTPIDSSMGVETTPINGPIYNASYRRDLRTLGGSPLFDLWKDEEGSQEAVKFVTKFIKHYKLDYGCGIFLSKQHDMKNVVETLRHAHSKLREGFKPKSNISAWITGLVKRRVGRENKNRQTNLQLIEQFEAKYKIKLQKKRSYAIFFKGADHDKILYKSEPHVVEHQLRSLVNYIHSISERSDGMRY